MESKVAYRLMTLVYAGLFSATAMPVSAENMVKGKFTVDGKAIDITHVQAYSTPGFFDKKQRDVVVLMCDAPVSPEAAKDPFGIYDAVKAGKLHCVRHTIDADKQVISYELSHNHFKMTISGGSTAQVFEPKTVTDTLIAGRSRTTSPQKSFDDVMYSYDITYSAEIVAPKSRKVGEKLPPGGGDLWKAYLADNKKIQNMNLKEMRKSMPPAESAAISDADLKGMKALAVAMLPKKPKYLEGYVNGNAGVIFISDGVAKATRYGTVDLIQEQGAWKVVKQDWKDSPAE